MQFLWSPVLWSLLLVPILVTLYLVQQTRRRKYAVRYASIALVKPALDTRTRWKRFIPPALFFLALSLMLIALARPAALVRTPQQEGIVILALDSSLSMRAQDLKPNRFEAARAAARTFVDKRASGAQVGIVTFAGNAAIVQLPTTKQSELFAAINTLFLQRGTAIGEGILTSLQAIAATDPDLAPRTNQSTTNTTPAFPDDNPFDQVPELALPPVPPGTYIPAIVVLLTDGQNRNGINPLVAAKLASERGVRVYTVGVGTTGGAILGGGGFGGGNFGGGFRAELDEETLRAIAEETGGEYFFAANAKELEKIYSNLGLNVVLKLEKMELTAYFTALAALLMLGAILLGTLFSIF